MPLDLIDASESSNFPMATAWSLPAADSLALALDSSDWKIGHHNKLYDWRGAHYEQGNTTFRVYAPNARNVSVILTAYGKKEHEFDMRQSWDGTWEVTTVHAQPGRTYLYQVVDCNGKTMLRTDPFSFSTIHIPEVRQAHSVVVDRAQYQWGDQQWLKARAASNPLESPLSIYELQMKSWKTGYSDTPNFREMVDELIDYCKKMGFTHVECYGLLEHWDSSSRGYQVANFFSPYRKSGSYDDFKYFVDKLHQNGIGVIVDWIPTHFQHWHEGEYSVCLHEFDGTNLFGAEFSDWGTRYLDYSKEETRRLMHASALYYLDEFHVDGFRVDAISHMVRRYGKDIPAGISFLQDLNDTIHSCYPGVLKIAEETEGFPNVTIPTRDGGLGFDLKWDIGWSHNSRHFLQTPYHERTQPQHWQHKVVRYLESASRGEKVIFSHSHDDSDIWPQSNEKVLLNCVSHLKSEDERFANLRNFFAFQTLSPNYGHLVHMGDEFVQDELWYLRLRKDLCSVKWSLLETSAPHRRMQDYVSDLNALYLKYSQFWQRGRQETTLLSEWGPHAFVAYHRGTADNKRMAVVHNFSNTGYPTYDVPLPKGEEAIDRIQRVQTVFNSDDRKYGGSGNFGSRHVEVIRHATSNEPTHFRLSLPPNATIVLEEELS